jgi:hypothetical protein
MRNLVTFSPHDIFSFGPVLFERAVVHTQDLEVVTDYHCPFVNTIPKTIEETRRIF